VADAEFCSASENGSGRFAFCCGVVVRGAVERVTDACRRRSSRGSAEMISVAGGLPTGVGYTLDGATHNNPQQNANLPLPFPDALQEFRIATSGLSAQNGVHSGAPVERGDEVRHQTASRATRSSSSAITGSTRSARLR